MGNFWISWAAYTVMMMAGSALMVQRWPWWVRWLVNIPLGVMGGQLFRIYYGG